MIPHELLAGSEGDAEFSIRGQGPSETPIVDKLWGLQPVDFDFRDSIIAAILGNIKVRGGGRTDVSSSVPNSFLR